MKRKLPVILIVLFCLLAALPGCRTLPPRAYGTWSETPKATATPVAEATTRRPPVLELTARAIPTLSAPKTAGPVPTPAPTAAIADPAPSPPAETLAGDKQGIIVYVTRTGEKYHRAGCSYLSKSSIETTLADAIAKGYTPCSKCRPPQ